MAERYRLIDFIRGFALLSMILYHGMWDAVYVFGANIPWYNGVIGCIWQMSVCITFIVVSGFCRHLGRRHIKNAILVMGSSVLISLVTAFFMPENIILFGILSIIGLCMLVMIPLDKLYSKVNPYVGFVVSLLLFVFTLNVYTGVVGIGGITFFEVPSWLYANFFTACLGFPAEGFFSADYFPVIPWIFLYQCGYFLYGVFKKINLLKLLTLKTIPPIEWLGRHSLLVYMLHQPLTYAVVWCIFKLIVW